ncbi:MAG: histidine phosphatase family protein [Planctomycetota bacterium]
MRELVVVRHGESEGNVRGIVQGRLPFRLTEKGRAQTALVARMVQAFGWTPGEVVTSPLPRCAETAGILALALGTPPPRPDDAFTEIDCGRATGRGFRELERENPRFFAKPPPEWLGFSEFGGESDEDVVARVAEGLDRLDGDAGVLLVTHGAVFKGVLAHLLGLRAQFFLDLRHGTTMRLERRRVGAGAVIALTHHLHAEEWAERTIPPP